MDALKSGLISKNARELEQHLSAVAGHLTTWAVDVQSSLITISHNTRGLLWWTSIIAAVIVSLFLIAALNSLRSVMVKIDQHQVIFRQMWEADRAQEDQLRIEEQQRKAEEADRLLRAITAAVARRGQGQGQGHGHGAGAATPPFDPAAAAAAAANTELRLQQMEDEIERLTIDGPEDPDENRQWMQEMTADIRARYADLLPPPDDPEDPGDWQIDSDDEGV